MTDRCEACGRFKSVPKRNPVSRRLFHALMGLELGLEALGRSLAASSIPPAVEAKWERRRSRNLNFRQTGDLD
jgi:hypothetical protein